MPAPRPGRVWRRRQSTSKSIVPMANSSNQDPGLESGVINEAIVLAGGLGTRLRSALPDLPKCMAPIAGRPFIAYLIDHYAKLGITKFTVSLGYKHEVVEAYLRAHYEPSLIQYSVEQEPLGTGGAIKRAISHSTQPSLLILNGDTFFDIDLQQISAFHQFARADCTLALKPMQHFDRYGVVLLKKDQSIDSFQEKKPYESGLINGGVYVLQPASLLREDLPPKFSFESEYLEKFLHRHRMFGLVQDRYFIDIGIPEDYRRAQTELLQQF
jgi:D-glycero-alpha-D-manno-heptose 1-phosphate guanylyltransferase